MTITFVKHSFGFSSSAQQYKSVASGDELMAQRLKSHDALVEDLSSSTHVRKLTTICNSASHGSNAPSGLLNSWTHKDISSNTNLHININKKSNNSLLDPEKAMSYGKRQENLSKLDMLRACTPNSL